MGGQLVWSNGGGSKRAAAHTQPPVLPALATAVATAAAAPRHGLGVYAVSALCSMLSLCAAHSAARGAACFLVSMFIFCSMLYH